MNEADARAVLLVQAWETAPAEDGLWSAEDRGWADRNAAAEAGEQAGFETFLAARARHAAQRIGSRSPAARRMLRALRWQPWLAWAPAVLALVLGMATDALGAARQVNILAPPLLALLAWNLAVYATAGIRAVAGQAATGPLGKLADTLVRWLARRRIRAAGHADLPAETAALTRFGSDWARLGAPLHALRLSRALHLSAVGVALGALLGMYLRGLAFEYRAGWESTFLDASQVSAIVRMVLGPAAALTGIALPDLPALQAMRLPGPGALAAPWIHLYAITVALVVIVPRLALALRARLAERRLAAQLPLPLDEAYFKALARAQRGETPLLAVLPWSHEPAAAVLQRLRSLAATAFGPDLRVVLLPAIAYGDEELAGARLASIATDQSGDRADPTAVLVLLPATATPEAETHGLLIDTLTRALAAGVPLLAVVDESAFVARFGTDPRFADRHAARRQAWSRLLLAHGLPAIFADLAQDSPGAEASQQLALALARRPAPSFPAPPEQP